MTIRRTPADVVQFTRDSAERISQVVRESENAPFPGAALTFGRVETQSKVFRIGTFSGAAWAKNATSVVTRPTGATVVAVNLFAAIGTAASTRNCAIAKDGTAWYLIAAEC